jgi:phenylpyruvate tautomerase PptA (4-oxalocrotonate tautomerase family)
MPLYNCISDARTTDSRRQAVAVAITESHCAHTGAPPEFVHVTFSDYLGGAADSVLRIVGNIRAGRPPELKSEMHADIVDRIADIFSVSRDKVRLVLQEVRAEWSMEGGAVLPTPGSEDDWMKKHWSEDEADTSAHPVTKMPSTTRP